MLWNGFLNLEALPQRVELMNTQIFVVMTSDISSDEMLADLIATFKVIGKSDYVAELRTYTIGCVIEFFILLLSSEYATEAKEAFAIYGIE
jgi:hypothetical protein